MKFWEQVILNNTVGSYLTVAAVIFIAIILKRGVTKYATALLYKFRNKQWKEMGKEQFDEYIISPLERLFLILVIFAAVGSLNYPEKLMFSLWGVSVLVIIKSVASGIFIIAFISLILRFLDYIAIVIRGRSLKQRSSENQLLFFFKDFIKVAIIIFGIIFVLKFSFFVDVSKLLTGLSIVGAALALAARESLENLIASFVIFFDKPFATGDVVKVKEFVGTVERIGLRSTRIITFEKTMVAVPNKQMVDNILDNWSKRNLVKNELKILLPAVQSSDDVQRIIGEMDEVVGKEKEVKSRMIYLTEVNNDHSVISVTFYTDIALSISDSNLLRQNLNLEIKKILEREKAAKDQQVTS